MKTTALFAEIAIGGLETLAWMLIFIVTIFGPDKINISVFHDSSSKTILLLAVAYILGIIFDRLWDIILRSHKDKIRDLIIDKDVLHKRRLLVFCDSKALAEFFDYIASRLRLARASIFNFIMITIAYVLLISLRVDSTKYPKYSLLLTGIILGLGLVVLSYVAWRRLIKTYAEQMSHIQEDKLENK